VLRTTASATTDGGDFHIFDPRIDKCRTTIIQATPSHTHTHTHRRCVLYSRPFHQCSPTAPQ
jgi:hypothetical protein